ncbi:MAG: transcriptional regulator GutM [Actinomycetota bacterium]|nr:transcriptional regulator GutM [Actinomycetota bacterium]
MDTWVWVLVAVAVLWLLQMVGTHIQMSHYRSVLGGITREGGKGFVGAGNAKTRFGKGVILILISDEDDFVKRALRMRGMTVFARFEEAPDLVGMSLDELQQEKREGPYEKATMLATRRAVEQIQRIKSEKAGVAAMS